MANLQANNAAGGDRVGSFKYFGPGTGTSPLPIYLAHYNGSRDVDNPAAYSGTNWTNTTFAARLNRNNPDPVNAAEELEATQARRDAAARAGLPRNLFSVNPDVNQSQVYESEAFSNYHALQIELRRRLSRGLQINGSYQYALEGGSVVPGSAIRPRDESDSQRPSRHQDPVGLQPARRSRPQVRRRHAPTPRRRASEAGSSAALAACRREPSTLATFAWWA